MGYKMQLLRFICVWMIVIYLLYYTYNSIDHSTVSKTNTIDLKSLHIPIIKNVYSPSNNISSNELLLIEINKNNNLTTQRRINAMRNQRTLR